MEVAFAKVQKADAEIGSGKAVRLIDRLGNLDCFFSMSDPLIELSTLGEAPNEVNRENTEIMPVWPKRS